MILLNKKALTKSDRADMKGRIKNVSNQDQYGKL
jgi:hypothetical protein